VPVIEWFPPNETDFTVRDFVIDVLQKCFVATFENLIKTNGAAEVLSGMKPHMKVALRNYLQGLQEKMQIDGDGPESLMAVFNTAQAFVIPTNEIELVITDIGVVGTIYACPFQGSVPEICVYFSHFASEEVCQMMNPDYECVYTHHLITGDPYCRWIFKRKDQPLKDPNDLGRTVTHMPVMEIPDEQLCIMKVGGISMQLNAVTSAFVHFNGPEKAIEVLYPEARRIGGEGAEKLKKETPCLSASAETLGLLVTSLAQVLNQRGVPTSVTPNEFVMEVTECACQTFSPEFCGQIGVMLDGMVQAMNPGYEFGYDRMITTGDKVCHWAVRRKVRPIGDSARAPSL
jgi:hypothetical protein